MSAPDAPAPEELVCAFRGHFTVGPTGGPMRCLRCGTELDGLGLDPRLSTNPTTQEADHA